MGVEKVLSRFWSRRLCTRCEGVQVKRWPVSFALDNHTGIQMISPYCTDSARGGIDRGDTWVVATCVGPRREAGAGMLFGYSGSFAIV
jgi:hypothetical protein